MHFLTINVACLYKEVSFKIIFKYKDYKQSRFYNEWKKKCCEYSREYLKFGFIASPHNVQLRFGLVCKRIFFNKAMKLFRLKEHLDQKCIPTNFIFLLGEKILNLFIYFMSYYLYYICKYNLFKIIIFQRFFFIYCFLIFLKDIYIKFIKSFALTGYPRDILLVFLYLQKFCL